MNRLKELRKNKGMTQVELAQILDVTQATLSGWENEKYEIDLESLKECSQYFGTSIDYILGETDETDIKKSPSEDGDLFNIPGVLPISTQRIPLLGEIACGEPIYADEDRESYVLTGTDIKADFCLRAKGDSMTGARIMDGDIVFIRKQSIVDNGEIAAVIIDNEATLKRVYYNAGESKLVLSSENPKYQPFVFVGNELEKIRIIGKAIAFQSDVL